MLKTCQADGPQDASILILTDRPGWGDLNDGRFLTDHAGRIFWDSLRSGAGILRSHVRVEALCERDIQNRASYELSRDERAEFESEALERLSATKPTLLVALGDWALEFLTGQKSADKFHLSILPNLRPDQPKVLSLLHPERVFKEHKSAFYLKLGAAKMKRESLFSEIRLPERSMLLRPRAPEVFAFLRSRAQARWLSVDIETSYGHITCIGIGSSPHEAMCIPTMPEDWASVDEWFEIWKAIAKCLSGPARKVLQNGIYDLTYLSSYGIDVANFYHDTMVAQRVLYPELSVGLDNIARIYTEEPYWKDEAKDWNSRQDIDQLYRYNCKDVCVTLAAAWAQRVDLERRGLMPYFENLMRLARGPVIEMSWNGLPLDVEERERLASIAQKRAMELELQLNEISQELLNKSTNPRSPVQVKQLLFSAGFRKLPFKGGKETSDKSALMKLRLKRPDSKLLESLIEISEVNKELSSYLTVEYDRERKVIPYTLYAAGTETIRMSCSKDSWNRGFNAQTVPSGLKSMFLAPEGSVFVEVDLKQADARVVAWDAAEPTLMEFFNTGRDIHRYVASQAELFNCAPEAVTHDQRQLGKKVGHAANYGVTPPTLVQQALSEMNLVLSERRAAQMLQGYFRTFPGIPRWHERIKAEISRTRTLRSPTGFHRTFMDRHGPELFKEAFAFLPQNIVSYTINQLVLALYGIEGVRLLVQIHDSCLFLCSLSRLDSVLEIVKAQPSWNPIYKLAGGPLRIPIEVKSGLRWGSMEKIFDG